MTSSGVLSYGPFTAKRQELRGGSSKANCSVPAHAERVTYFVLSRMTTRREKLNLIYFYQNL